MRKGITIGAIVIVLTGAGLWLAMRLRQRLKVPLTTVQAFSNALAKDDLDAAYALTSSELRAATSREALDSTETHLVAEFGKPVRFEAGNIEMEANQYGTHEIAEGRWVFQNGQPTFKFDLKFEDGRWLIFSFEQK